MPRQKVSYKTKRSFRGNQYKDLDHRPRPNDESATSKPKLCKESPSSKKLSIDKYDSYEYTSSGNCIFDISILSANIRKFVKCKYCDSENCVDLVVSDKNKHGLAVNIEMKCCICLESSNFFNSKFNKCKKYDINLKFVYGMRSIGKGLAASNVLCALLDLPSPPQKFESYNKIILDAVEDCANVCMKDATMEAVSVNIEESGPITDLAVCLDGSWQKRGHSSLNGFVSVTSFDTGKVLDVAVMSKYCQVCTVAKDRHNDSIPQHICTQNYSGSSGGMEVAGALQVFRNSVDRGVRYVKYLGDGDSNGFKKVSDEKPYGDAVEVVKLECVNHVKKRMGTRLRELKKKFGKQKLDDGKGIGGRNRLTDKEINKLQEYYGLAIVRGGSNLEEMKKNVWATYFHKLSDDDNPQHGLCPSGTDSWCGYNKAKSLNKTYKHKHFLPVDIMTTIKKIYQDLANPELLKKCLHQKTQNPNESFNNSVWSKIPKNVFVRLNTLKLGVLDALLSFNDGFASKLAIYNKLDLPISEQSVKALRNLDILRIKKSEKAAELMTKEARTARKKRKLAIEAQENQSSEPEYGAGMF